MITGCANNGIEPNVTAQNVRIIFFINVLLLFTAFSKSNQIAESLKCAKFPAAPGLGTKPVRERNWNEVPRASFDLPTDELVVAVAWCPPRCGSCQRNGNIIILAKALPRDLSKIGFLCFYFVSGKRLSW